MTQKMTPKHAKEKNTDPPFRVFLSYAAKDRNSEAARKLRSLLTQHLNHSVFTPDTLSAGENWMSKLKRELARCDVFMVLLSQNSISSANVLQELGAAWALNKPVIGITTQQASPSVIFFNMDHVVHIDDLEDLDVLRQLLAPYDREQVAA